MSKEGDVSERRLTNKDFRNIVLTARSVRAIEPGPITIEEQPKRQKLKQPRLHKLKERSGTAKTRQETVPETPYRDRAKERREGRAESELGSLTSAGTQLAHLIGENAENASGENIKPALIETDVQPSIENKIEVKGLDYGLLEKTKSQLKAQENEVKIVPAAKIFDENVVHVNSILAKNIYNAIFDSNDKDQHEMYLPGRKIFVYKIDKEYTESFIPIISTRSRLKPGILEEKSCKITSDAIILKLNNILSYLRGESRKPDINRQIQTHAEQKKPKDDLGIYDEDIGEYNPQDTIKKYIEDKMKAGSYFDEEKKDKEPKIENDQRSLIRDLTEEAKVIKKKKENTINKEALKHKLMKLTAEDETYVECYQPFETNMQTTIGSDDEADKIEPTKKSLINPWDFASQEEYDKYINTKKQIEKGIRPSKIKQPEKKKGKKESASKEKAKLDKQWEKINTIMSERKFTAKLEDDTEAPPPKRKI